MKIATAVLLLVGIAVGSVAQGPTAERQQFIRVEAPVVVLTHVRIIDGTGAAARDDQTIVIANGKIQSIGAASALLNPRVLNVMSTDARVRYLTARARVSPIPDTWRCFARQWLSSARLCRRVVC